MTRTTPQVLRDRFPNSEARRPIEAPALHPLHVALYVDA